jgi:hypothetical protein
MKPTPQQVRDALRNHQKPPRTRDARVRDAIAHVRNSNKQEPGGNRAQKLTFSGVMHNEESLQRE